LVFDIKEDILTIKSDIWIEQMAQEQNMIDPFVPDQIRDGVISYGLGSYGYDIRVADEFKIFTNINSTVVDPKEFDAASFVDFVGPVATIPPNSFALARSIEYMRMPRNVTGILLGKSTYARCGIVTNFTPLEAGWEGHITIEISNTTPLPARIYAKEGIAQILFFASDEVCRISYADRAEGRGGKYQGQIGITVAKVETDYVEVGGKIS
jgi:dCTP deaminase